MGNGVINNASPFYKSLNPAVISVRLDSISGIEKKYPFLIKIILDTRNTGYGIIRYLSKFILGEIFL